MNVTQTVFRIERLLPQTQCRECGYDGCLPYARAVAAGADANLCLPGGKEVADDLARLLDRTYLPPVGGAAPAQFVVRIEEDSCIGCTACIRVCPADAVLGAKGQMHGILADECTGCGLCIPACPVDCMEKVPSRQRWLPVSRSVAGAGLLPERQGAAEQARVRFEHRNARKEAQAAEKERRAREYRARFDAGRKASEPDKAASGSLDPAALLAKAAARAGQMREKTQAAGQADDAYARARIAAERERAARRRAMHRIRYGSAAQADEAVIFLRSLKQQEEEQG